MLAMLSVVVLAAIVIMAVVCAPIIVICVRRQIEAIAWFTIGASAAVIFLFAIGVAR